MTRKSSVLSAVVVLALLAIAGAANAQVRPEERPDVEVHPINPHGADTPDAVTGHSLTTGSTGVVTPAITFHGGKLISVPNIYYIWYGNWNQNNGSDTPAGQQILRDFAGTIGGSPYFQLNQTYSAGGTTITGGVGFGGETTDTGSQGTRLKDSSILAIVNSAITSGRLPYDANGVYFVLSSSNVSETSGFCTRYCGWHTSGTAAGQTVRYSFVGNANRCLNACAAQTTGPNGNAGVDAMASVIAHELEEATSDPDPISGWADSNGAENADKCAWTFGQYQQQLGSGAWYNVVLGARPFLIQRNLQHNSSGDLCKMDATHN